VDFLDLREVFLIEISWGQSYPYAPSFFLVFCTCLMEHKLDIKIQIFNVLVNNEKIIINIILLNSFVS
jgi:hypothetical protein